MAERKELPTIKKLRVAVKRGKLEALLYGKNFSIKDKPRPKPKLTVNESIELYMN